MEDCSMSNGTPEISAIVVCFNTNSAVENDCSAKISYCVDLGQCLKDFDCGTAEIQRNVVVEPHGFTAVAPSTALRRA